LKIVLTNDDGIDAPGIHTLSSCLETFSEITIVAPAEEQSGVGHRTTSRQPILVTALDKMRYRVNGTPADCARIALKHIVSDADWLISGINPGANLGSDVYKSGTVAAAREAAILGYRAIAISQYIGKDHQIDWDFTFHQSKNILKKLLNTPLARGYFWNVNLPCPRGSDRNLEYKLCNLDTNPYHFSYRINENTYFYEGDIHDRPRSPGKDVAVCFDGLISVTRIALDTTEFNGNEIK
jgi:5'-nucleotidase